MKLSIQEKYEKKLVKISVSLFNPRCVDILLVAADKWKQL